MLDFDDFFFQKKFDPLISNKMVPGHNIPNNEEKIRKTNTKTYKKQHIKKTSWYNVFPFK